jgi:ATP-dependent Lhr-like helicase
MPLSRFHPAIAEWWQNRFATESGYAPPTPAQARGWESIRAGQHTLIAAPTGSGKTLAAFLTALDDLLREGLEHGSLPDETRVLYVSPLKALSADIHKNLAEPRREIRQLAESMGLPTVKITAAVRTGDTPQAERAAMLRTPPHILVTTPESLYLLLTAERSREMLRTVRTVIIDEIHAVVESRRGAHLALSLERLEHVIRGSNVPGFQRPAHLQRIALSATQKPIERVAQFMIGARTDDVSIIDEGHVRELDLAVEVPGSPLEAVMSQEIWQEVYARIIELIESHRTTLVFVNTRRLAERIAHNLTERLGADAVGAHHGSLSKDVRLDAEERLKTGRLRALVATSSLELGIDIGHVDLVCQIGSTHRISALLQRVGRSGHTVGGRPKGRLFPLTRDDLIESTALLRCIRRGELDHIIIPEQPLDVLAQQIVAETACEDWSEESLYTLFRRAYPYRDLPRKEFDEIVAMVSNGFATQRGRRGALVHYDAVNHRLRGRKSARLAAITSGGAIPEVADYRVILEPEGTFIGSVNEDFAVESMAGDVFALGNASWRILRVQTGIVRVEDAHGQPPGIPFWFGEAPGRSVELSGCVSEIRSQVEAGLADDSAVKTLVQQDGLPRSAAEQIVEYLRETKRMLGVIPTQRTIVLERFFDESGGMQIVLHAPFGSRVNRAWGLALRKRFCRTFNFELQAAATEEGIVLSLGPQHSFPLEDVFQFLRPETVRETLVQALFDAPLFQTRWRWNTTLSLAILRYMGGRKIPPQLQRVQSEDLLSAVFPEATACLEHIVGDREVPDHPLIRQTLTDCLDEAMDLPLLITILADVLGGQIQCVARDTPEPSPISHEILNARPYAFLDDAPLEERRTHAVYTRRSTEPAASGDLGALDIAAIERVRAEAWPDPETADELHDALLNCGIIRAAEGDEGTDGVSWKPLLEELIAARRATRAFMPAGLVWCAAERLPELRAIHPHVELEPRIDVPAIAQRDWTREDALRELVRGRLESLGPVTAARLAIEFGVAETELELAFIALEAQGTVLRGFFTPGAEAREWCDRRLLARIHRYTLNRLRAEIEPVYAADFMRFLFRWQRVSPDRRAAGIEGLAAVIEQLDAFEVPAAAWEESVLPARFDDYDPQLLDMLCLSGRVAWGRLSPTGGNGNSAARPLRSSPVSLFLRENRSLWLSDEVSSANLSTYASEVQAALERRGASFFHEIVADSRLLPTQVEQALGELAATGLVTADGFSGLRALLTPTEKRARLNGQTSRRRRSVYSVETAGRWSLLRSGVVSDSSDVEMLEMRARTLLRRYGVVFRRLLDRESGAPPWRELVKVYRRMEARGELRGGRFINGFSGEQFALPDAVVELRAVRKAEKSGKLLALSAADPLNLTGIVTTGERIGAIAPSRVVYRDGVPVAAVEAGKVRILDQSSGLLPEEVKRAIQRRSAPPVLRPYLRRAVAAKG